MNKALDKEIKSLDKEIKRAVIAMIIASSSFAMMAVMVKLSGGRIPLFQQVFFRNLIMIVFSGYSLIKNKASIYVEKNQRLNLTLRSLLGFAGVVCVFYASNNLPLAVAQILQKLNPIFVVIFAVIILGERLTKKGLLTTIAAFAGAVLVINPGGAGIGFSALWPGLVGILSALFGGLAYVMVGRMKGKVDGMVIIFYFSLFSTIAAAFPMAMNYVAPTGKEWLYLIMIGIFAAGGQYFITKAYTGAAASRVTIFDYTGVVLSPVLGIIIFSEGLTLRTFIGMVIIIASGYIATKKP